MALTTHDAMFLGALLRRFLLSDAHSGMRENSLLLDGWIDLDATEVEIVQQILTQRGESA